MEIRKVKHYNKIGSLIELKMTSGKYQINEHIFRLK